MHQSSYERMTLFRDRYLSSRKDQALTIMDLGSQDVNGSYRPIFENSRWRYIGIDMAEGKNVDVVLRTPYVWREVETDSADVVVSGQAFEHISFFWITMLEVARVLKPGGICCILAPSGGPEHRYPADCWRFYSDGMAALADSVGMEILEVATHWEDTGYIDGSDWWHDSILVGKKPDRGFWRNSRSRLKRWLQHRIITIGMR